ncbi:Hsp20/alpha crystallin family protein [bacterium]|nr:Hsp20/alpha crystallin family protein [bacterium]
MKSLFEQFMDDLEKNNKVFGTMKIETFPKYKVTQTSQTGFILEIALAGYNKKNIKVKTLKNKLSVGYISDKDDSADKIIKKPEYPVVLENQIARRDFEKVWETNADYEIKVKSVSMDNGILKIELDIEIPENLKEKEYTIK